MPQSLSQHASQHSLQTIIIAIRMFPHLLNAHANAHLVRRDAGYGVKQVEIGELPVHAVVDYVEGLEAVGEGVVDCEGALEGAGFERERGDLGGVVGVVVGVYPCLGAGAGVGGYEEDDVFRP